MPIVTFLNQKGGVGKTSTCHHLAGTLSARFGRKVLLVDNDPQASLTQGLWGPDVTAALDANETVGACYAGLRPVLGSIAWATGIPGVDLVPGSALVSSYNVPEPWTAPGPMQRCLASALEEADGAYDLVLIDCPPNLHLCAWAALATASHLVVPLQAEDYGAQGLGPVREAVARARVEVNPGLVLAGYLITMFDRRPALPRLYETELRLAYGPHVFEAVIPRLVEFAEAIARRRPVAQYRPKGAAAAAMEAVASELLARLESTPVEGTSLPDHSEALP